jgi:hypothetical protein
MEAAFPRSVQRSHRAAALRAGHTPAAGAQVDAKVEDNYGRFGWASDPEGNRFELWEPELPSPSLSVSSMPQPLRRPVATACPTMTTSRASPEWTRQNRHPEQRPRNCRL